MLCETGTVQVKQIRAHRLEPTCSLSVSAEIRSSRHAQADQEQRVRRCCFKLAFLFHEHQSLQTSHDGNGHLYLPYTSGQDTTSRILQ